METYPLSINRFTLVGLCLLLGGVGGTAAAAQPNSLARAEAVVPAPLPKGVPWDRIGAKVGADYQGDGLRVTPTAGGARLHCVFQRLDGEATRQGLWLASTVRSTVTDRFRVMAVAVGRDQARGGASPPVLPGTGKVEVAGQTVRFVRPGLVEEYSVSMEGVRQDFVVVEKLAGEGELRVGLEVSGAKVEAMAGGARLALEPSGRKIAYNRLRATDAKGKQLPARIEVASHSALRTPHSAIGMVVAVNDAGAVYPVRIDPTFSDDNWVSLGGLAGANGFVWVALADGAGNLYLGGEFTAVGATAANRVAKWDGSKWSPLGLGMDDNVYALAVSGTNLYAGGAFTTAGDVPASNIAKWDGNAWSPLSSGAGSAVFALAVSGSDLYAGGAFTTAGGSAANYIAKWDGSTWSALGSGVSGDSYAYVEALAVSGSDLYAAGGFTIAGGVPANCVAKWNGSAWSALGSGISRTDSFHPYVRALAVLGADLYAGGEFNTAGGSPANGVARWNGSAWSQLGSDLSGSTPYDPWVVGLAVSGSDLYVGGSFINAGGIPATNIAKWNGSTWSALASGINSGVYALSASGSTVYAGGDFTTAGGNAANSIAKWNGSAWSALGSGMNDIIRALAVSGSNLYAGGDFTTVGGGATNHIAKWNGNAWSALGSGMNGSINALAVSGSDLYAGGSFTNAGGVLARDIAKWDGSGWSALGSGMNGSINALAVSGSDLYAGGNFTNAGGVLVSNIAKWNGSTWSAVGAGMNGVVNVLAVSGSDLYAGGSFTTAGGNAANSIAKWNGSAWSALGSGRNGTVRALAVSGSDLYASSEWLSLVYIAKWDGSAWSAVGSLASNVMALAVSGSDLYVGGSFSGAGGTGAGNIAKWNGSTWSALGSGMNNSVWALAVSGSDLYAGGAFTTAGGKASAYVAKAITTPGNWLRLQNCVPGSGTNTLDYVGVPSAQYLLQFATNLTTSPWFTLATNTVAADGRGTVRDGTATNVQRFYRIASP